MNVYDFDKTIYIHDCTQRFYLYMILKAPKVLLVVPKIIFYGTLYFLHIIDKTKLKSQFFTFVTYFTKGQIDKYVKDFWKENRHLVFDYYIDRHKVSDIVVSASPSFIVNPMCEYLGVKNVICTEVDFKTGFLIGKNCYGEEKVARLKKAFPHKELDEFFSDSYSDTPLAKIAKKAYMVKSDGRLVEWENR